MRNDWYATFSLEQTYWQQGYQAILGIDEVGRGSWAGPLVACGVVFPVAVQLPVRLADSKLLRAIQRQALQETIFNNALAVTVVEIPVATINTGGIGEACHMAYRKIVSTLKDQHDFIFMDAFYIKGVAKTRQLPIIRGDRLSATIAAASIIAKEHRDDIMRALDAELPQYAFARNKGYGTAAHQKAITEHGLSVHHRLSFSLEKYQSPNLLPPSVWRLSRNKLARKVKR